MLAELQAPAGFRGIYRDDDEARAVYSEGAGIGRILPLAVAQPADADDVVTLVRWAALQGVPLTARGSGSSMGNGAIGPGVIVDLARLNAVGSVNTAARVMAVGPAVTRAQVDEAAGQHGLTFPVDPSSGAFATIGGMCATNAAGARTLRYGAMRRHVSGLDCVFADGSRAWLRRGQTSAPVPALERFLKDVAPAAKRSPLTALRIEGVRKQSSGYGIADWAQSGELIDLIIGSEGTLAIIVGVELMLSPRPGGSAAMLAGFPDLEGAAAAAVRLVKEGACAVELLDRSFLEIAASGGDPLPIPLPPGLEAVLVIEAEDQSEAAAYARLQSLAGWCEAGGALHIVTADDAETRANVWKLRHAASPILNRLAPRLQSMQVIEDGCVPPARFAEYVRGVRLALKTAGFRGVIFGHAGDAHAHANALVDINEPGWQRRLEQLLQDVTTLLAQLGGTAAGEHGDGRLRAPLLPRLWSTDAFSLFTATKRAFDPDAILNPGVILAEQGAKPLESLKYDPALPPLPARARAALDLIVQTRRWNADRLALLAEISSK